MAWSESASHSHITSGDPRAARISAAGVVFRGTLCASATSPAAVERSRLPEPHQPPSQPPATQRSLTPRARPRKAPPFSAAQPLAVDSCGNQIRLDEAQQREPLPAGHSSIRDPMLPPCHSRHDLPAEPGWYACSHPQVLVPARRVHAGICLICQYSSQPPPAQPIEGTLLQRAARARPCRHLGERIGERLCPTCGGHVRWKLFRCHHASLVETTLQECQTCGDFEATSN